MKAFHHFIHALSNYAQKLNVILNQWIRFDCFEGLGRIMYSDSDRQIEGFFAGAYDFTRTNDPSEYEAMFRVLCFCTAVKTGDTSIVDALLQEGFDVNETVEAVDEAVYVRPLSVAILEEQFEMAKHLIARGAEVGNASYEVPSFGTSMITAAMQQEPTRAISMILGFQAVRERMKGMDSTAKTDGMNPVLKYILSRSPLSAACYVKSADLVEALLNAGAEFGEYYYLALGYTLDDEKPCTNDERNELLDLVLNSRDRIGFDRFVEATRDFEQYVNGEWRRNLASDDYSPAEAAQERAWRTCDRLLTSPAYRKRMPMSQLLYAKYCDLTLDDIVGMIAEVSETIDSASTFEALASALLPLNARRNCFGVLSPLTVTITPHPSTGKKVLVACPKFKNANDETGELEAFKTVVIPLLQEKAPGVELNLDECDSVLDEIAVVGDLAAAHAAVGLAMSSEHTVKDYRDMFGVDMAKQLMMICSLYSMNELIQGEDQRPFYYDEASVSKAIDYMCQDNLEQIKNYMKCSYAYSFTKLIQAKASEQNTSERFSTFAAHCGPLINDELSPIYLESTLDDRAISELEEMFVNIKAAYRKAIEGAEHLSEDSRIKALHKLDSIDLIIVGRTRLNPPLEGTLIIDDWNFVDNYNRLTALYTSKQLACLLAGDDESNVIAEGYAWDYNACYSLQENNVKLFGAYLLPPAYSSRRSSVMNYAAIGRVMGHEISHAFDPKSIEMLKTIGGEDEAVDIFSSSPSYIENSEKLKKQFEGKVPRRLVQAYPALAVYNEFDSGKCLGENFADVVGLEIALYAYALSCGFASIADLVQNKPEDVRLFMQSYALSFREKPSLNLLMYQMMFDVHAPNELRANTVKNLDAFHEVFGTKEGDGMWLEPEERVSIFGIK